MTFLEDLDKERLPLPCMNEGFICMPRGEFEKLIKSAISTGISEALTQDNDIRELRGLLQSFREAKSSFWQTTVRLITTAFFALLVYGFYYNVKNH